MLQVLLLRQQQQQQHRKQQQQQGLEGLVPVHWMQQLLLMEL
jgi:hypothetical protein